MLQSITMRNIATFGNKGETVSISKKIVIFYGHNGAGKSTIARSLQKNNSNCGDCIIVDDNKSSYETIIYNTDYINDTFFQNKEFKGIFTLGKDNKDAFEAISKAESEIIKLEEQRNTISTALKNLDDRERRSLDDAVDCAWREKDNYSHKDLEYCIIKYRKSKSKFWGKLKSIEPVYTHVDRDQIISEASLLNNKNAKLRTSLYPLPPYVIKDENLISEVISGSKESPLAELINQLNNSDWIRQGRPYLSDAEICPFCQQDLPPHFLENIERVFDETYAENIRKLSSLKNSYDKLKIGIESVLSREGFLDPSLEEDKEFSRAKNNLLSVLKENTLIIDSKINYPSQRFELQDTQAAMKTLSSAISKAQEVIRSHNSAIQNKDKRLEEIKNEFWSGLRIKCDEFIENQENESLQIRDEIKKLINDRSLVDEKILACRKLINENNAKITNIDLAILSINNNLKKIGVDSFSIVKSQLNKDQYALTRSNGSEASIKSLSEGEKTMISFLYFIELCGGAVNESTRADKSKRIIVLDDPISSLSHNYLYEVADTIWKNIIRPESFRQVIILTHSMFFFHEIFKALKKYAKNNVECFRVIKDDSSKIIPMGQNEIKNDYQSYWSILKDIRDGKVNAIIAPNIMRNILEYYFSFIHKTSELEEKLTELELADESFKPLYRYINRESHSDELNLSDLGTMDPTKFIEKMKLVFDKTGYTHHYNAMMGI